MLSNIKLICNYKENNNPSLPQGVIYYMDNISSNDEWVINEHKRRNRQSVINTVLNEKQEKYDDLDWIPQSDSGETVTSPRVMSQSVVAKKFISEELLYDDIISVLDNITSNPMKKCQIHPQDMNIKLLYDKSLTSSENMDANSRRIITKMTYLSNVLSMKSRLGKASIFIIGDELLNILSTSSYTNLSLKDGIVGNINGVNVIHSSKIGRNKVIATVTENEATTGLNVINNVNNGDYQQTYFIKETPTFENRIVWFEISQ